MAKSPRHTDTYPAYPYMQIPFMKFVCSLQRLPWLFICLKSETKCCKPHDTPSTWPLEDQEFYMSCLLQNSHSNTGQNRLNTNVFPSGTSGAFQHWKTQHIGTEIMKVPLEGKALYAPLLLSALPYLPLYSSLLYSILFFTTTTIAFSILLFSTLL